MLTSDFDTYRIGVKGGKNWPIRWIKRLRLGIGRLVLQLRIGRLALQVFWQTELVEIGRLEGWNDWANVGLK